MRSRSTLVDPNASLECSNVLSADARRSKCNEQTRTGTFQNPDVAVACVSWASAGELLLWCWFREHSGFYVTRTLVRLFLRVAETIIFVVFGRLRALKPLRV